MHGCGFISFMSRRGGSNPSIQPSVVLGRAEELLTKRGTPLPGKQVLEFHGCRPPLSVLLVDSGAC
jgi:hypothetical protein